MEPNDAGEAHVAGGAEVHAAGEAIEEGFLRRLEIRTILYELQLKNRTHKQRLPDEVVGLVREGVANEQDAGGGEAVARGGQKPGEGLTNGIRIGHPVPDEQALAQHGQAQLHQLQQPDPRQNKSKVDAGTDAAATEPDAQRLPHSPDSECGHLV